MSSASQNNKTKRELLKLWIVLIHCRPVCLQQESLHLNKIEKWSLTFSLGKRGEEGPPSGGPTKKPSKASLEVARRWLDSGTSRERLERLASKIDNLKEVDKAEYPETAKKPKGEARYG